MFISQEDQMEQGTKDALMRGVMIGAYVFLPWSLFCFAVGGTIYVLGRVFGDKDDSGDAFLTLVVGAPVTLPMMPFIMLRDRREQKLLDKLTQRNDEICGWLLERMEEAEIEVTQSFPYALFVKAVVRPDQVSKYREIYAAAVSRFAHIPMKELCENAKPLELLDRDWAERHGLEDYAISPPTPPCAECGKVGTIGWIFGKDRQRYWIDFFACTNARRSPDDTQRRDYVCNACQSMLDDARYGIVRSSESVSCV